MTKVTKISCTAAVILMSTVAGSALAGSRIYAGGELGGASYADYKLVSVKGTPGTPDKSNTQSTGESGSVYLGVGQRFTNGFDLAGQLEGTYFNAAATQQAKNTDFKLHENLQSALGASIMPGWYFAKNSKLYVKVGAGVGQLSSKSSGTGASEIGYSGHFTKSDNYVVYGAGFATKVSKHLRLGLEYDHYQFTKFDKSEAIPGTGVTRVINYDPTMNMGAMTLTYVW